jgi:leader peptidase (prepilin peptidase)/N-methyltransferase
MLLTLSCGILGLLVGSFLNVVIYRYPIMLFNEWEAMAKDILIERKFKITNLNNNDSTLQKKQPFNLVVPRSTCPKCHHLISSIENIPLFSYLFLMGKCKHCQTHISIRYPFIELLTAICFALLPHYFSFGWPLLITLVFTSYFIAMSFIDIDHQILPDTMTIPLVWFGLLAAHFHIYITLDAALIGAIVGYLSLWSVYWLFKLLTGKDGMGYGDFKLLAVIGALLGWEKVLLTILLSAAVGSLIGGGLLLLQGKEKSTKIPFGPYLITAGWISWLWGDTLIQAYTSFSGIDWVH